MNFKSFTYDPDTGETPDEVPFIRLMSYSLYTNDIKCRSIESPVIEMIDLRLAMHDEKIAALEQKNIQLENRISRLENRIDRLAPTNP